MQGACCSGTRVPGKKYTVCHCEIKGLSMSEVPGWVRLVCLAIVKDSCWDEDQQPTNDTRIPAVHAPTNSSTLRFVSTAKVLAECKLKC